MGIREGYGRVLARDVKAGKDSPPGAVSHFDGYAVRASETASARGALPVWLRVRGPAARVGSRPRTRLKGASAVPVLTGGLLPVGADAVVAMEDVREEGGRISVPRPVSKGALVYPRGADVRRGDVVLRAGATLAAQDLTLLASLRIRRIAVMAKPRVAILPTGSELTSDIGDTSGKVVESHSLLLEHLIREAGGSPSTMPIVADDLEKLSRAMTRALGRCEVLLTVAGTSVGAPDLVDAAVTRQRADRLLIHGLRVNRGRVMGVAAVGGKPIVMLPGPVQGALNAFVLIAYPLIRSLLGLDWEQPPTVEARVTSDWEATGRFRDFTQVVYVELKRDPESPSGFSASPATAQTEKVSFLVTHRAYTIVSGRDPVLRKGQAVAVHLLPGLSSLC